MRKQAARRRRRRAQLRAATTPADLDALCVGLLARDPARARRRREILRRGWRAAPMTAAPALVARTASARRSSAAQRELAALRRRVRGASRDGRRSRCSCAASRAWARARWCAASSTRLRATCRTRWCCRGAATSARACPTRRSTASSTRSARYLVRARRARGGGAAAARRAALLAAVFPVLRRVEAVAEAPRAHRRGARSAGAAPPRLRGAARAVRRASAIGARWCSSSTICSGPTPIPRARRHPHPNLISLGELFTDGGASGSSRWSWSTARLLTGSAAGSRALRDRRADASTRAGAARARPARRARRRSTSALRAALPQLVDGVDGAARRRARCTATSSRRTCWSRPRGASCCSTSGSSPSARRERSSSIDDGRGRHRRVHGARAGGGAAGRRAGRLVRASASCSTRRSPAGVPFDGPALEVLDAQAARRAAAAARRSRPTCPPISTRCACDLLRVDPARRPTAATILRARSAPSADRRDAARSPRRRRRRSSGAQRELAELRARATRRSRRGAPSRCSCTASRASARARSCALPRRAARGEPDAVVLARPLLRARVGAVQGGRRRRRRARRYCCSRACPTPSVARCRDTAALLVRLFPVFHARRGDRRGARRGARSASRTSSVAACSSRCASCSRRSRARAASCSRSTTCSGPTPTASCLLRELSAAPKRRRSSCSRRCAASTQRSRPRSQASRSSATRLGSRSDRRANAARSPSGSSRGRAGASISSACRARPAATRCSCTRSCATSSRGHGGEAGATLDDALSARVALLRPDARALLEVVCIAGAPISLEVAAQACRLDATAVDACGRVAARRDARARDQRGRRLALEPYHDRVREQRDRAALGRSAAQSSSSCRRKLRGRRARRRRSARPALARCWVLARAVRWGLVAAQACIDTYAFNRAIVLYREVLQSSDLTDAERHASKVGLAHSLSNAGRLDESALAFGDAAAEATGDEQIVLSGCSSSSSCGEVTSRKVARSEPRCSSRSIPACLGATAGRRSASSSIAHCCECAA